MRSLNILAAALALAFPLASAAQQKPEAAKMSAGVATAPGAAKAGAMVTASAVVESVDPATRAVVLKLANGETHSFVASDEVRNFDQIKKGDKVSLKYAEALTLELKKGDKAVVGRKETGAMERSKPGEKPGGVVKRELTVVAEVMKVDAAGKRVAVKTDKGETVDLAIEDPEQLKLIKKGDKIQATYTQALAISMEPAMPAAPAATPKKDAAPPKK